MPVQFSSSIIEKRIIVVMIITFREAMFVMVKLITYHLLLVKCDSLLLIVFKTLAFNWHHNSVFLLCKLNVVMKDCSYPAAYDSDADILISIYHNLTCVLKLINQYAPLTY